MGMMNGMMGSGMGMGQGMMGSGMNMGQQGMAGMGTSGYWIGSLFSVIFNLLLIAAVLALFVGLIGLIYSYAKGTFKTTTETKESVGVKENTAQEITVVDGDIPQNK